MKEMRYRNYLGLISVVLFLFVFGATSFAQSTGFTYQGSLNNSNLPANGNYDFEFKLFTALSGGTQDGTSRQVLNVPVTDGTFSVLIDFGAGAFPGADRFLDIAVKPAGGSGFTMLTPRQQITPTPYALKSSSADQASFATNATNATNATTATTATNAIQLGGVLATQFVQTNDPRMTDARNPLPNSTNYIQNGNTPQPASRFNISGTGTANIFNAGTQYNINNDRILGNGGIATNTFVGFDAGLAITTGTVNSFFGNGAGSSTTTATSNSFFGVNAGSNNTTGFNNSFFGVSAGNANTTGSRNTLVGYNADANNNSFTNATAIGANALVGQSNALILGAIFGVNGAPASTDVGIGTTTPTQKLDVNGNIRIGTGSTGCVQDRDGTVIAGACSSDLRFKKNITPFGYILSNFSKLRPVNFYWHADEFPDKHFGTKESYGLIAQEVEEVFPDLISTDEQGYKAVNYSKLPLLTIQAVNELKAENDTLKRQVEQQQKQLQQQQNLIDDLRKLVCQNNPQAEVCK